MEGYIYNITHYYDYDYDYDYPDEVCDKGEVVKYGSIVSPIFFSIVIILSLIGNILILVILALYENMESLTNIFIANLAISDLVFAVGLPFWAIYHIWGWVFSEIACKILTFVFLTGFYSNVLFLTIMTIYTYLVAVGSLSIVSSLKAWIGICLSVIMWIISIGAAMPSLLQTYLVSVHHNGTDSSGCEYRTIQWKLIDMSRQNIFFLVAFAVMAFCYIQILRRITRTRSQRINREVRLVFCNIAICFVCWVPYNVVIFLRVLHYAFYVCQLIAFSHCCLNPVFYAFVGVKFRNHFKVTAAVQVSESTGRSRSQNAKPRLKWINVIDENVLFPVFLSQTMCFYFSDVYDLEISS